MTNKWVLALLLLLLQACGVSDGIVEKNGPDARQDQELYEATGMVLEQGNHQPLICLGVILTSLPPQCGSGDVRLIKWDWSEVKGEKERGDTISGRMKIAGVLRPWATQRRGSPQPLRCLPWAWSAGSPLRREGRIHLTYTTHRTPRKPSAGHVREGVARQARTSSLRWEPEDFDYWEGGNSMD